jgi:nicotinate-nucleotide pyrophosphorylase (carboxylating)
LIVGRTGRPDAAWLAPGKRRLMSIPYHSFGVPEQQNLEFLVARALAEDLGPDGDITSRATIPDLARGAARLVARSPGVLAGLPAVELLSRKFELHSGWRPRMADGDRLEIGSLIAQLAGPVQSLLAMERTALNFLQRLSGIATLTARYVAAVEGTRAIIYDTRKTTPGWRFLEKYAVRCGGGANHRFGLYDAVLIKDNHLAWIKAAAGPASSGAFASAIAAARRSTPRGTTIEIEVDSLEQLDLALAGSPDIILVDNLGPEHVALAVRRRDAAAPQIKLEASGGVNLCSVRALAETGVDRISIGALTHSAPALDLALDFEIDSQGG